MIIAPRYDGYYPKLIEIPAKEIPPSVPASSPPAS
jgi:hypothetical protein